MSNGGSVRGCERCESRPGQLVASIIRAAALGWTRGPASSAADAADESRAVGAGAAARLRAASEEIKLTRPQHLRDPCVDCGGVSVPLHDGLLTAERLPILCLLF